MSNPTVDAKAIEKFLVRLGQCYRLPGRLYLVGGSSLILVAAKASTYDIDISFEVEAEHEAQFIKCVREVGRELDLPVEQVSPAEFLPLPAGYEDRRRYIGRFGALDVFHFDPYSVALSKLERMADKDLNDVISMVQKHVIDPNLLERYFHEILPDLETLSLKTDRRDFERKFAVFQARLRGDA